MTPPNLKAARKDIGISGRPNKFTRWYAERHGDEFLKAAWCDQAQTYWARHAGVDEAVLPNGDRAFTVWHADDGRQIGRWHAGTVENILRFALPGALIFYDWGGTNTIGKIDHIGIIEVVLPDGRVQTIEANTGDAVKRRVRSADVIAGFWNPDYEGEDMPSAKEIAEAVFDRFTGTVTPEVWAAKAGILEPGTKIDPRTANRQTWAYGKDTNARVRELQGTVTGLVATVETLAAALAAGNPQIDQAALIEQIKAAIEGVTVRLDVADDVPATTGTAL